MASYGSTNLGTASTNTASRSPAAAKAAVPAAKGEGLFSGLLGGQPPPQKLKVPQKDLLVFFRQLSVVLQSGVSLAQGLSLIAENMTNKKLTRALANFLAGPFSHKRN